MSVYNFGILFKNKKGNRVHLVQIYYMAEEYTSLLKTQKSNYVKIFNKNKNDKNQTEQTILPKYKLIDLFVAPRNLKKHNISY